MTHTILTPDTYGMSPSEIQNDVHTMEEFLAVTIQDIDTFLGHINAMRAIRAAGGDQNIPPETLGVTLRKADVQTLFALPKNTVPRMSRSACHSIIIDPQHVVGAQLMPVVTVTTTTTQIAGGLPGSEEAHHHTQHFTDEELLNLFTSPAETARGLHWQGDISEDVAEFRTASSETRAAAIAKHIEGHPHTGIRDFICIDFRPQGAPDDLLSTILHKPTGLCVGSPLPYQALVLRLSGNPGEDEGILETIFEA